MGNGTEATREREERDLEILIEEINRILERLPYEKLWQLYIFTYNYA